MMVISVRLAIGFQLSLIMMHILLLKELSFRNFANQSTLRATEL